EATPPERTKDSCAVGETQELRALSVQEIELRLKAEAQTPPLAESEALEGEAEVAAPELEHALYDEHVRGFDEGPTLLDAVGLPPRPVPQPDFRRGERPDQRKERRLDAHELRESNAVEVEQSYREYELPEPARAAPKKPKARKPRKTGKRKKR